jgi:GTP-binding protein EngB required for normal cell division
VTADDPLEALLRRCHRDELLPLCEVLRVRHVDLGLGDLARVLSATLRRVASNGLGNLGLRRGEGEPYLDVLARVAGVERVVAGEEEAVEARVVRAWIESALPRMPAERRAEFEAIERTAPGAVVEAYQLAGLAAAVARVPRSVWLGIGIWMSPIGCLGRILAPIALPLWMWWVLRPDPELSRVLVVLVARLRQVVAHRVTVGFVGSPSTGKDAAIRAVFGIASGNISPIAGSTKEVAITALPGATALYVVNTPGLGDVVESVSEEARQVLGHVDVYVYVVNAEGGVQARELADWKRCVESGKPSLAVVNKIDVLRERDRERYLADARAKLGAAEEDFLAVAFDPLPELAAGPIGVEAVRGWLRRRLMALGKEAGEVGGLAAMPAR